jgi:hypothetical protein
MGCVQEAFATITPEMVTNSKLSLLRLARLCLQMNGDCVYFSFHNPFWRVLYRVSINDCRVQPAMESCQILNVPLSSAINECHIFRLGCWLLTRDKFQLCFTLANINVFII